MGAMCTNVLLVPHVQFLYMTMDLNIYINMFLISEMSEFDPRGGGGQNSSKMFDIQNFFNPPRGRGRPNLEFFPIF